MEENVDNEHQETGLGGGRPYTRRGFISLGTKAMAGFALVLNGCASLFKKEPPYAPLPNVTCKESASDRAEAYAYIVVGSGAGGGPLAANLAKAGHRVLLLEAGGAEESFTYQVPAFHGLASEDDAQKWSFFVRHYASETQQARDDKYLKKEGGVLYPRAGTLGGCTAHHAMITIYPHKSDWDGIAEQMNDPSWSDDNMRQYFERLERCRYVDPPKDPADNPSRHGFTGWLTTHTADPTLVIGDGPLKKIIKAATKESVQRVGRIWDRLGVKLKTHLDPNDWRWREAQQSPEGLVFTPISTQGGKRVGARDAILQAQRSCPENLTVRTGAFVTRVIFTEGPNGERRATGVEYLDRKSVV